MTTAIEKFSFHGDELEVVRTDEGRVAVSIRRVCMALGVDYSGQLQKLKNKPWGGVEFISTPVNGAVSCQEIACLDLDSLPMWLATIEPGRVAEGVRAKLETYQRDAAKVLADHFLGRRGVPSPVSAPLAAAATVEALVAQQLAGLKHAIVSELRELLQEHTLAVSGIVGPERAKHLIKIPLAEIAAIRCSRPHRLPLRREVPRVHAELRAHLGFFGEGRSWEHLPESMVGIAVAKLAEMRASATRLAVAALSGRQLELVSPSKPAPTSLAP